MITTHPAHCSRSFLSLSLSRALFIRSRVVTLATDIVAALALTSRAAAYSWQPVPIRSYTEFTFGLPGGEGEEHPKCIARCPAAPDFIYLSIDIAGTWRSTNGGLTWMKNRDKNLYVQQLQSCAVDPLRSNRVFVVAAHPAGQQANYGQFTGIYRSNNGGFSWTNVLQVFVPYNPSDGDYQRLHRNLIACRPPAPNESNARIWYACIDESGIFTSTNAGRSWELWCALTNRVFYCLHVLYDEAAQRDVLYVGSNAGLFRYYRQGQSVIAQNLHVPKTFSPQPGFDEGVSSVGLVVTGTPPVVARIWATRFFDKAYYAPCAAPTSTAQWIEANLYNEKELPLVIPNTTSNDWPGVGYARLLFVNPFSNACAYLVTGQNFFYLAWSNNIPRWIRVSNASGFTNNPTLCTYKKTLKQNHTGLAFHPTKPHDIVAYGQATLFRSESGGRSWVQSNHGYIGYAWTFGRNTLQFHPTDSNTVMMLCNDVGVFISTTRWDWFWGMTTNGKPAGLWAGTTSGDFDRDSRSNLFCMMGIFSTGFRPVRSTDGGLTWKYPAGTNISVHHRHSRCTRYTNNKTVYAAYFYSTNDGATIHMINFFDQYPGRTTVPNPGVNPPYTLLGASTNVVNPILYAGNCNGFKDILRGELHNGTYKWSLVYSYWQYPFNQFDGAPTFAVDPHRPHRFYGVAGKGRYLVRYDTNLALTNLPPVSALDIVDFLPYLPRQAGTNFYNHIAEIDPDPTQPDVVFVGTGAPGLPFVFKVQYVGVATVVVEDITGTLPRIGMRAMRVDPWSGDVFIGSHAGTYRLPRSTTPQQTLILSSASDLPAVLDQRAFPQGHHVATRHLLASKTLVGDVSPTPVTDQFAVGMLAVTAACPETLVLGTPSAPAELTIDLATHGYRAGRACDTVTFFGYNHIILDNCHLTVRCGLERSKTTNVIMWSSSAISGTFSRVTWLPHGAQGTIIYYRNAVAVTDVLVPEPTMLMLVLGAAARWGWVQRCRC